MRVAGVLPPDVSAAPVDEPLGAYLDALERAGRTPREAATAPRLRELVVKAETLLARGDAHSATALLFGVVEAQRFSALAGTDSYQNAEFLLKRALSRGRAFAGADRYLSRVLVRGPSAPYFVSAFRAFVDMALETGRFAQAAARLQSLAPASQLPADSASELAYVMGRAAWGDWGQADSAFAQVGPASRLYPAALYFRALVAVQQQDFKSAKAKLCLIADQKDQDRVSFNVDQRFFRLKDMARLALARLAHEQGKYDEAYYYYFAVPEESERSNSALFERLHAAAQKNEKESKVVDKQLCAQAAEGYGFYLEQFPDAQGSITLRYYRADILYFKLGQYRDAGDEYLAVGKSKPVGELHKEALLQAMSAFEKLRPPAPKTLQEKQRRKVTDEDRKFAAAADLYAEILPW